MAERKSRPILQTPDETQLLGPSRLKKRWKTALIKQKGMNKDINKLVEAYYKDVLAFVKPLISTLPDTYSRTVFERDYREDSSENSFAMHSFITPSFFWYLECDYAYRYRVEYDFHNCPFEEQIRNKLSGMYTLLERTEQRHLQPNCEEFLKRVFKVQDEKYRLVL